MMKADILKDKLINKVNTNKESIESIIKILKMNKKKYFMKVNFWMVWEKDSEEKYIAMEVIMKDNLSKVKEMALGSIRGGKAIYILGNGNII